MGSTSRGDIITRGKHASRYTVKLHFKYEVYYIIVMELVDPVPNCI